MSLLYRRPNSLHFDANELCFLFISSYLARKLLKCSFNFLKILSDFIFLFRNIFASNDVLKLS